ncbi:MAG: hypothetical protein K6C94_09985 [Candidatus Gastranaerophilales bacterium]|nr:hypothetical protein [Candidatus Gastranaerophilales bacterium]
MILQFGSHGWGTTEEISTPETNIICENCGEKMVVIKGCGIIHSGYNKFYAECPKCKAVKSFSDYELFKKCWHEGMEVYSKKREQRNHEKMITEELCQKAEKLLTEENRQNLMYNTTEEITEKFSGEK